MAGGETGAEPSPLDLAHAAMEAAPEDDAARLRYYARLADSLLWLWLADEAAGDTLAPRVFQTGDGPVVLAFDREERLAEAAGQAVPYAALPGRVAVRALAGLADDAGHGVALGINLGAGAPAYLIPPDALRWLAVTLDHAPQELQGRPVSFHPPGALPPVLLGALDERLARAGALARAAHLAGVTYHDGRRGHLLAFAGVSPGAEAALARAVAEALVFSGLEAGEIDVAFPPPGDPALAAIARAGLRIDLPAPPAPAVAAPPPPPGTQGPPRLR
ncbi:MAG: SseB family protein [Paracoccaceae bacterium]|nr:MAG: SseB family protein [Paracoccaceae bacterium]